jgi:hypothetical protein
MGLRFRLLPTFLLLGCHALAGIEGEFTEASQGGSSGGPGSAGAGTGGEPPTCVPKVPPAPIASDDTTETTFVVAIRSVDFGEDEGVPRGFDLDGRCTCGPEANPSETYPSSCKLQRDSESVCDGEDGIDGQSARLFKQFATAENGFDSSQMSFGADKGFWSVLLRIEKYNGTPNDDTVRASLYSAVARSEPPLWDGTDVWNVDPRSLADGVSVDQPLLSTESAYVADGRLVMSLDSSPLFFTDGIAGGVLTIRLVSSFFVARIESSPSGTRLVDGTLTGKWPAADIFSSLDDFRAEGVPVCTNDVSFFFLKTALCNGLDINAGAPNPAEPCDAISFGISFEAEPAQLGSAGEIPMLPPGCPPETLPSTTTCD